jgi:hypothetical protein
MTTQFFLQERLRRNPQGNGYFQKKYEIETIDLHLDGKVYQ